MKRTIGASVALFDMKAGDHLDLVDVAGHGFDLDRLHGRDLVFVAMGTGVAPLRSVLRHVLQRKDEFGKLVVLYGPHAGRFLLSRRNRWLGRRGRRAAASHLSSRRTRLVRADGLRAIAIDHVLPDLKMPVALVCGSREMIAQTRDRLQQMGFAPQAILTNY